MTALFYAILFILNMAALAMLFYISDDRNFE